jgi:hypothetical protein
VKPAGKIVHQTLSQKTHHKKGLVGAGEDAGKKEPSYTVGGNVN